jgi:hypothetical protein
MSDYRVATGHDEALVDLTVLSPQPRSKGIQYTRRVMAADGSMVNEGPYVELVWDVVATDTVFRNILTAFGLASVYNALVTVYVRDDDFQYVRKNGRAIRPTPGDGVEWSYFPRSMTILVRELEAVS